MTQVGVVPEQAPLQFVNIELKVDVAVKVTSTQFSYKVSINDQSVYTGTSVNDGGVRTTLYIGNFLMSQTGFNKDGLLYIDSVKAEDSVVDWTPTPTPTTSETPITAEPTTTPTPTPTTTAPVQPNRNSASTTVGMDTITLVVVAVAVTAVLVFAGAFLFFRSKNKLRSAEHPQA